MTESPHWLTPPGFCSNMRIVGWETGINTTNQWLHCDLCWTVESGSVGFYWLISLDLQQYLMSSSPAEFGYHPTVAFQNFAPAKLWTQFSGFRFTCKKKCGVLPVVQRTQHLILPPVIQNLGQDYTDKKTPTTDPGLGLRHYLNQTFIVLYMTKIVW